MGKLSDLLLLSWKHARHTSVRSYKFGQSSFDSNMESWRNRNLLREHLLEINRRQPIIYELTIYIRLWEMKISASFISPSWSIKREPINDLAHVFLNHTAAVKVHPEKQHNQFSTIRAPVQTLQLGKNNSHELLR